MGALVFEAGPRGTIVSEVDTQIFSSGPLTFASGTLVSKGAMMLNDGAVDIREGATVRLPDPSHPLMLQGGSLTGEGTVDGDIVQSAGVFDPLESGAEQPLTVHGSYVLSGGGRLVLDIGSDSAPYAFDGAVAVAGIVTYNNLVGFAPGFGDQRTLLTAGSTLDWTPGCEETTGTRSSKGHWEGDAGRPRPARDLPEASRRDLLTAVPRKGPPVTPGSEGCVAGCGRAPKCLRPDRQSPHRARPGRLLPGRGGRGGRGLAGRRGCRQLRHPPRADVRPRRGTPAHHRARADTPPDPHHAHRREPAGRPAPAPYTSTSTEAIPLARVGSVSLTRMVAQQPDGGRVADPPVAEAVLAVGWGAVSRVDLEPAECGDPECVADHGYTGALTSEDFSLRISATADGSDAVAHLLDFCRALSAATVNVST